MILLKRQHVARNPVARAIAREQLRVAMLDMRINLMMMEDGENCKEAILTISDGIFVVAACYEMLGHQDSVEFRKLRSAMNILTHCSETGFRWKREWAITVDNAIDICSANWSKIPSLTFQRAVKTILG